MVKIVFLPVYSSQSAALGGAAHLVNFCSTDTGAGLVMAQRYYGCPMAGFSIPAAEHRSDPHPTLWLFTLLQVSEFSFIIKTEVLAFRGTSSCTVERREKKTWVPSHTKASLPHLYFECVPVTNPKERRLCPLRSSAQPASSVAPFCDRKYDIHFLLCTNFKFLNKSSKSSVKMTVASVNMKYFDCIILEKWSLKVVLQGCFVREMLNLTIFIGQSN